MGSSSSKTLKSWNMGKRISWYSNPKQGILGRLGGISRIIFGLFTICDFRMPSSTERPELGDFSLPASPQVAGILIIFPHQNGKKWGKKYPFSAETHLKPREVSLSQLMCPNRYPSLLIEIPHGTNPWCPSSQQSSESLDCPPKIREQNGDLGAFTTTTETWMRSI